MIIIEIVQLQSGALAPPKKKIYAALECRIENLRQKYMVGQLAIDEYLLRITNNLSNK